MSLDEVVRVRMSSELLEKIDKAAEAENRSRSSWIRNTLKNNLKGDDNMQISDKLEKVGYEKVKRTARDDYFRKIYSAEEYYQDPEVIPEGTKSVLSRIYPEREYADYINFTSENPTQQEIANANKIHEDDYRALINNLHEDIVVLIDDPNHTIIADEFEQIINLIQEYDEARYIFDNFNSLVRYIEQQELGKKYEYYPTNWDVFREELNNWIKNNFAEFFDYLDHDHRRRLEEYVVDDVISSEELQEILENNFPEYWEQVTNRA